MFLRESNVSIGSSDPSPRAHGHGTRCRTRSFSGLAVVALAITLGGLAGCGGNGGDGGGTSASDPRGLVSQATDAMSRQDWGDALADLESAIEALGSDGDTALRARAEVLRAECLVRSNQGDEGRKALMAIADAASWKDFKRVGEALADEDFQAEAVEVLDAGVKRFPDHKESFLAVIADIQSGEKLSPEAKKKLESLGYMNK